MDIPVRAPITDKQMHVAASCMKEKSWLVGEGRRSYDFRCAEQGRSCVISQRSPEKQS